MKNKIIPAVILLVLTCLALYFLYDPRIHIVESLEHYTIGPIGIVILFFLIRIIRSKNAKLYVLHNLPIIRESIRFNQTFNVKSLKLISEDVINKFNIILFTWREVRENIKDEDPNWFELRKRLKTLVIDIDYLEHQRDCEISDSKKSAQIMKIFRV